MATPSQSEERMREALEKITRLVHRQPADIRTIHKVACDALGDTPHKDA